MQKASVVELRATPERDAEGDKLLWDSIEETRSSKHTSLHRVVIAGGGAAGLELATRLGSRFGKKRKALITLVDRNRTHIWKPLLHEVASGTLNNETDALEFMAHARAHYYRYRIGEVVVVWSAGIKAPGFLKELAGLETDRINRLVVSETLQTTRDPNICAIGDCACCVLPGDSKPLPPRAQTAHQQAAHLVKTIGARLKGKAHPAFRYQDFGSLVSLADYRTFGNIIGGLKIEGLVAKMMYRSLHQMHLRAVHGSAKTAINVIAKVLTRRSEPRIKLH